MKKRWLACLSAVIMVFALCFGSTGCTTTKSNDAENAKNAIHTLKVLYEGKNLETNDDYEVYGQVKGEAMYDVVWTISSASVDNIENYVRIGTMDANTKQITIGITRATFDIQYTLKASVTVGKYTETAEFPKSIAKKSSEDAETASLDFSNKANRTTYDSDNNTQIWSQNGITLTNTGNIGDYAAPVRLYKNTTVTIEMQDARIAHIDFHSAPGYSDSPYPEYLKTSLEGSDLPIKGDIAVSEDGLTFGVDFEQPMDAVTFKTTAGQCRLTSIDVEGVARDPNEHVHSWNYQHIEGTWTHTATCTAEGCDVGTKTENCTPKLNVCDCGYTYSAKEIVDALFALETGKSLPGTYSLTGVVTNVTELDTSSYKNVTFDMTVEGKTVIVFRAKGSHYSEVEVGGTATVNGELLDYDGKKEFTSGGSVVAFTPGVDDRTPQQKVDAALAALESTLTVNKIGETELPAATVNGVTFNWSTDDGTYHIANNKINVTELPEADATVTATVTATYGSESVTNNTKTVTITIISKSTAINYGSIEKPLTVAELIALANTIEGNDYLGGADSPIQIVVKGIVVNAGSFSTDNSNWTKAYIADTADASSYDKTKSAQVYRLAMDGTILTSKEDLVVGATITIQGWLQIYNGQAEVSHNKATNTDCKAVAYTKPAGGETPVEENLIYTLTTTAAGENTSSNDVSNYTVSSPCTVDGIKWDVLGNTATNISNWRFGGKSGNCNGTDRTITGRGAIIGTVKSVKVTFGDATITVNSVTLKVFDVDPTTEGAQPIASKDISFTANGSCTVEADDDGWTDCYYQLVLNLTSSNASKNQFVVINNVKFYGGDDAASANVLSDEDTVVSEAANVGYVADEVKAKKA